MLRVGLTGGIASGKSLVASMLGEFGAKLVDADVIAREIVEPGQPALAEIVTSFGSSVLDAHGRLDRRSMRERVFADPHSRRRLEALLHPIIRREILQRMEAAAGSAAPGAHRYVVAVVPLLAETGFAEHVDRVLLVECPAALQLERLMQRDGISAAQAQTMLNAQADPGLRRAIADDVIDNSHSIACTRAQAWRRHLSYLNL
ncbi:MAG: dephospho-CoA kinase [Gammaproteobacteria bacterium]